MICRKVRHQTTYAAAKHILSLVNAGKAKGKRMGIYYCGKCDAYHITKRATRRCISYLTI